MQYILTSATKVGLSRFAVAFASLNILAHSAFAGTYTIVGVDWYPSNAPGIGTDGGIIHFGRSSYGENPLDLQYGLVRSISAPFGASNSTYANPAVQGLWRWKIRWVGVPGEPVPYGVQSTVQIKGSGGVQTGADCWYQGAIGSALAQASDPYFPCLTSSSAGANPSFDQDSDTSLGNGSHWLFPGTSTFTWVSGTTYEGYVDMDILSQAQLSANGSQTQVGSSKGMPIYRYESGGSASVNVSATIRLTHVDNQRVQIDL